MCFALFLGARVPPPLIPHSGKYGDAQASTEALKDYHAPVRAHFSLPHVVFVGSGQGGGCGFRNVAFGGDWPEAYRITLPDYNPGHSQANHVALAALLRQHLADEEFVELYGCWEGDFALPELDRREVTPPGFHFHQLGYCRVVLVPTKLERC